MLFILSVIIKKYQYFLNYLRSLIGDWIPCGGARSRVQLLDPSSCRPIPGRLLDHYATTRKQSTNYISSITVALRLIRALMMVLVVCHGCVQRRLLVSPSPRFSTFDLISTLHLGHRLILGRKINRLQPSPSTNSLDQRRLNWHLNIAPSGTFVVRIWCSNSVSTLLSWISHHMCWNGANDCT